MIWVVFGVAWGVIFAFSDGVGVGRALLGVFKGTYMIVAVGSPSHNLHIFFISQISYLES